MDSARGHVHYPSAMAPKPLKVRKPTVPFVAGSQPQRPIHKSLFGSFLKESNSLLPESSSQKKENRHRERQLLNGNTAMDLFSSRSTISSFEEAYLTDTRGEPITASATRSTSENLNPSSQSETSSIAMIGDFVPMEPHSGDMKVANTDGPKVSFETQSVARKVPLIVNPYEFDLESPYLNHGRQTTFADFINSFDATPYFSPQPSYINTFQPQQGRTSPRPTSLLVPPEGLGGATLRRSDSSPSAMAKPFPGMHSTTQHPESVSYYHADRFSASPEPKVRVLGAGERWGRQPENVQIPGSPYREVFHTSFRNHHGRTPQHLPQQKQRERSDERDFISPRIENLEDVTERDDIETTNPPRKQAVATPKTRSRPPMKVFGEQRSMGRSPGEFKSPAKKIVQPQDNEEAAPSPDPSLGTPSKRSHSPMKKMFGEHGWLGYSPSEINEHKFGDKYLAEGANSQSGRYKKTMMGKIKTKLEEIVRAEKADMSPLKRSRNGDKHARISVLAISLGPPEQARILMEIELMLVHTANSFIMSQFSQGRIVVDSIKKIVDMWKSKGRPIVTEFMYDQATQRELVVANQHNFRFHGETAVSDVRIASMLYNWKNVASLMAVRTFCVADSVLLKLVFDVEQILELLGAGYPILLRLQAIRAIVNEMMRMARQKNTTSTSTSNSRPGRETGWPSATSTRSPHRSHLTEAGFQQDPGMPSDLSTIPT